MTRRRKGSESHEIPKWIAAYALLIALLLAMGFYKIYFNTAIERQMGIVQKVMYIHVPSAMGMYLGWSIFSLSSALYLWKEHSGLLRAKATALAVAAGEVGQLCALIVLITGPLWGRKAWGVFWTWDARLTTTLLASMIFGAALMLRKMAGGEVERRMSAAIAVLGLPLLAIIHYATQVWRGQHPKKPTLEASMQSTLSYSMVVILALVLFLIALRYWVERREEAIKIALDKEEV